MPRTFRPLVVFIKAQDFVFGFEQYRSRRFIFGIRRQYVLSRTVGDRFFIGARRLGFVSRCEIFWCEITQSFRCMMLRYFETSYVNRFRAADT